MTTPDHLTDNFTVTEWQHSQIAARHGRPNIMDELAIRQARRFSTNILEPLRARLGVPITLSSGYRSDWLNTFVSGSVTSAHRFACAADIHATGFAPIELCQIAREMRLPCDQIIYEFGGWCHLGQRVDPFEVPRYELLTYSTVVNDDGDATNTEIHAGLFDYQREVFV